MKLFLIAIAFVFSSGLRAECIEEDINKIHFQEAMNNVVKDYSTSVQIKDVVCFKQTTKNTKYTYTASSGLSKNYELIPVCYDMCIKKLHERIIAKATKCDLKDKCKIDYVSLSDYAKLNNYNVSIEMIDPYNFTCSVNNNVATFDMTKVLITGTKVVFLGVKSNDDPDYPNKALNFDINDVELRYVPTARPHFNYKWQLVYRSNGKQVVTGINNLEIAFVGKKVKDSMRIGSTNICGDPSYSGSDVVYNNCAADIKIMTNDQGKPSIYAVSRVKKDKNNNFVAKLFVDPDNTIEAKTYDGKTITVYDQVANVMKQIGNGTTGSCTKPTTTTKKI